MFSDCCKYIAVDTGSDIPILPVDCREVGYSLAAVDPSHIVAHKRVAVPMIAAGRDID